MDQIYQKASDTAVWLGESRGTSEIEVIRDLLKRLEQLNVPEAERVSRDEELKKKYAWAQDEWAHARLY
jgi:hypothetical protein